MSNYPKIRLKMNTYLQTVSALFVYALHPAAGKAVVEKKRKRASNHFVPPRATPDSLNIRDIIKKGDSFRRNPAP